MPVSTTSLDAQRRPGPADRRQGEPWTQRQAIKNWTLRQWVRGLLWLADHLPSRGLLALCAALGTLAWALLGHERRVAAANLSRAGIDLTTRTVFRTAGRNLGLCLLLRRRAFDPGAWLSWSAEARDTLRTALAEGRGVIFVSAHLGPFELVPAFVVAEGFPSAIVVRESYDPELDPLVDAHRVSRGIEVIHRGHERAPLRILRALRRGLPVGFLPDVGGRVSGTSVSFLGGSLELPVGPLQLAQRLECPLLLGTLEPAGSRFTLAMRRLDSAPKSVSSQELAGALEAAIRRLPGGWLWMARDLSETPSSVGDSPSSSREDGRPEPDSVPTR